LIGGHGGKLRLGKDGRDIGDKHPIRIFVVSYREEKAASPFGMAWMMENFNLHTT